MQFHNSGLDDLMLWWANEVGVHHPVGTIKPGGYLSQDTFVGHAFRATYKNEELHAGNINTGQTLAQIAVEAGHSKIHIEPCGTRPKPPVPKPLYGPGRDQEFATLLHDQDAPCEGIPSKWSCARCLTPEQLAARKPQDYGYHADELSHGHKVGQIRDVTDDSLENIPYIPILSSEHGYTKMNMTERLRSTLLNWWDKEKGSAYREGVVSGGYTNNHVKFNDLLDISRYPAIRQVIDKEMEEVLQWWTQTPLRWTATYGTRVYKRGSMLIDHVDRSDTHLASAVLQIAQEADPEHGWPLEVIRPDGTTCEVYLQPGEMVLYEGARIMHGRPERFNGTYFANAFTHFAPESWVNVQAARRQGWKAPSVKEL